MLRTILAFIIIVSSLSGCLQQERAEKQDIVTSPIEELDFPDKIDWFDASSNGAPGNRFTLATDDGIVALDQPDEPWTIQIYHGSLLENELTYTPSVEPWNLAATIGPRGPVLAYRSPAYDIYVAEWNESKWVEGKLAVQSGEVFSFPSIAGSNDELVLGFPVITSPQGARYSVIRLSDGIPKDLSDEERLDFATVPVNGLGDVAVLNESIAISYMKDSSAVELRFASWQNLSSTPKHLLAGPNPLEFSQSLHSHIAWNSDGLLVAITEWAAQDIANDAVGVLRPAILYNITSGENWILQTRSVLDAWATPKGAAVVWTDAQATFRVGSFTKEGIQEVATVYCTRFAILPNGLSVTLGREESKWISNFGLFPSEISNCAD